MATRDLKRAAPAMPKTDTDHALTPGLAFQGEAAATMRNAEGFPVLEQRGGEPGAVRRGRVPFEEALDEALADPEMRAVLAALAK